MNKRIGFFTTGFLLFTLFSCEFLLAQTKSICITIDDLPVVSLDPSPAQAKNITSNLLFALRSQGVPAIGFVNEQKLLVDGKPSKELEKLLRGWEENHLELGNHTFSHLDYNTATPEDFEKEIVKGGQFTNELYKSKIGRIKYFRHPYLHVGNTQQKKEALTKIVATLGYIEAPVTIDNGDYIFARAYDIARQKNDTSIIRRIGQAYVPYMMSKVKYYETQSIDLFGKNISHILLMHANSINAEFLSSLIVALKKDGYQFVSLTEALKDPLYLTPDNFVGNAGISWIHRWAITQGKPKNFFGDEPRIADFILKYAGFESE
ncbi:polysaccharide deacetylase family protein [soil metagenome]